MHKDEVTAITAGSGYSFIHAWLSGTRKTLPVRACQAEAKSAQWTRHAPRSTHEPKSASAGDSKEEVFQCTWPGAQSCQRGAVAEHSLPQPAQTVGRATGHMLHCEVPTQSLGDLQRKGSGSTSLPSNLIGKASGFRRSPAPVAMLSRACVRAKRAAHARSPACDKHGSARQ